MAVTTRRRRLRELDRTRPNAGPNPPRKCTDWNPLEVAEFEAEVAPVAEALGYEHRVSVLTAPSFSSAREGVEKPSFPLSAVLKRLFG